MPRVVLAMIVGQWASPSGYGVGSSSPTSVYNIQDEFIEFQGLYFYVKLLTSFESNEMDIIKKKMQLIHPMNGKNISQCNCLPAIGRAYCSSLQKIPSRGALKSL